MTKALLVGCGGFLGSALRYAVGGWVFHRAAGWAFPVGTLVVNVTGCAAAGLLAGLAEKRDLLSPDARLFPFVGVLGGYTTFSAFGLETVLLLQRQQPALAALNASLSVGLGLLALWLGLRLA
jgi:CrcB protein